MRPVRLLLVCVAIVAPGGAVRSAAAAPQAPVSTPHLQAIHLSTPPVIDGRLDDDVWSAPPLATGDWQSYNPLYGDTIPQRTDVWVAYDADALYFAFRCDDPEPGRIKTSITRRDNIWSDDWVGLSLDALGTGQTSYHLMVNPSGIQLDMINTLAGSEDPSPDWIWDSAARVDERGYTVEIRLPLQTIRFHGGDSVQMGVLFWRRISRTGVSVAWPPLEPGKWVFQKHAKLEFTGIQPRPTRELIPSAVLTRNEERATPREWGSADSQADFGLSAKWGLTPTITLDATVNPDFSQVESDAFQIEVNQRFPVFFSEKRPFFMEGAGLFNLAGNAQGDASMLYAVHTRKIVDPIFGAKVTGSARRVTFGTLTAIDQGPGRTIDPADPLNGKEQLFQVARAQVSLNTGSFAGAMATFTHLAGRTNAVAGGDLSLHFRGSNSLNAFLIGSNTGGGEDGQGIGTQARYSFSSRRVGVEGQVEHYDRGFVMDTAFMNRVGFSSAWGYTDYSFYPDKNRHPWVRRVSPFAFVQGGRDRIQGGDEHTLVTGVRVSMTRQGFLRVDRVITQEAWHGVEYDGGNWRGSAQMQLFRWLRPSVSVGSGRSLFYDEVDPFLGDSLSANVSALFQFGGRFSEDVEFSHSRFDRIGTGERIYTVDVLNTRTTYQFSKELAARAIVRFDSQRHRVLTDLLGSYDLRPGTVVYAGYGSLYQKRDYRDAQWIDGEGDYLTTRQGLFLKASYLFRF
jgi:hypothetical protein